MRRKKGQLSIETMILYGLIALVALSAVAALIYFDVLNLGTYLPDTCDLGGTGDLKCEEMQVSGTKIQLGIRNVGQKPISEVTVTVDDETDVHFGGTPDAKMYAIDNKLIDTNNPLAPGEIGSVKIEVGTLNAGQSLDARLITSYKYKNGAILQESEGRLRVKVS